MRGFGAVVDRLGELGECRGALAWSWCAGAWRMLGRRGVWRLEFEKQVRATPNPPPRTRHPETRYPETRYTWTP